MARIFVVEMGAPEEANLRKHGTYGFWFKEAIRKIAPELAVDTLPVDEADAATMRNGGGVILSGAR